jgi:glycosyltransferase involved in cell wall biosynthesis
MQSLCVFTENHFPGGGNRYLVDLVNGVSNRFDRTHICSNASALEHRDLCRLNKPACVTHPAFVSLVPTQLRAGQLPSPWRRLALLPLLLLEPLVFVVNLFLLRWFLERMKPTMVLGANGGYPGAVSVLSLVVAARWSGIPVVLSIVSMPARRRFSWSPFARLADWMVGKSATRVVVNAEAIGRALAGERGLPMDSIRVIHNGLESDIGRPLGDANHPRAQTLVVGCVARMDAEKGVLLLLEAFSRLAGKYPEARLILAGDGNALAELKRRVAESGLTPRVSFLGHYDGNVNDLLAGFDIYAFPSLWEGFPYSIIEAMRAGCAIVSTNVGGIPEAIEHGKHGLLVQPGSVEELQSALCRLLGDPHLRAVLARGARERFEHQLSLESMHRRVSGLFQELVPAELGVRG